METWKKVAGYEDLYEVSDIGRVRRIGKDKCLKPGLMTAGYQLVNLSKGNRAKTQSVHRLVATAFFGAPNGRMDVNHKNGIRTDNRVENLEWMTRSQNQQHAMDNLSRKHTSLRGEMVRNAKLNESLVRTIKARLSVGDKQTVIASDYGVCKQVVWAIQHRHAWAWVA